MTLLLQSHIHLGNNLSSGSSSLVGFASIPNAPQPTCSICPENSVGGREPMYSTVSLNVSLSSHPLHVQCCHRHLRMLTSCVCNVASLSKSLPLHTPAAKQSFFLHLLQSFSIPRSCFTPTWPLHSPGCPGLCPRFRSTPVSFSLVIW